MRIFQWVTLTFFAIGPSYIYAAEPKNPEETWNQISRDYPGVDVKAVWKTAVSDAMDMLGVNEAALADRTKFDLVNNAASKLFHQRAKEAFEAIRRVPALASLRGIERVAIVITVGTSVSDANVGLAEQRVRTLTELKLRKAGIALAEGVNDPKASGAYLYVSVEAIEGKRNDPYILNVNFRFNQKVDLAREPKTEVAATTWSTGMYGSAGRAGLRDQVERMAGDCADEFINDFQKANAR